MNPTSYITETARNVEIKGCSDVLVVGGGPAGAMAAIAAARAGARVQLIEEKGCLGGIWTAGLLSWMLDATNKTGLTAEAIDRMAQYWGERHSNHFLTRPEICKFVLEQLCQEAGVSIRFHTRLVAAQVKAREIAHVITESKSGREAWAARAFVDATGDGDLGALSGCEWDYANPDTGEAQPFSLIGLVTGIELDAVADCVRMIAEQRGLGVSKINMLAEFHRAGIDPSYHGSFLAYLGGGIYMIMWNHIYGGCGFDADDVTRATLQSRIELHQLVEALRTLGGRWQQLQLVATADQIGVREGRRIRGHYTVTEDDLRNGAHFDDEVCEVRFNFDVHATNPKSGKLVHNVGRAQPYGIPLRALISADRDNLFMAGRCISGDFLAHSSYRVTGAAAATGEAAGKAAAKQAAQRDPAKAN